MLKLGLIAGLVTSLVFIGGCVPAEGEDGGFDPSVLIFPIFIIGIFYLLLIRPQRKRQKEHKQMESELKVGDRVITAGGIYGKIESLSEDSVVLRIESDARIRIARSSIAGTRPS